MTTYLTYELLDIRPPRNFDASESVENFTALVDSKAGAFAVQWMSQAHPWSRFIEWYCYTRQDIQDVRDFLTRRQGMCTPFWVPTWAGDFLLTANATSGASSFITTASGRPATETNVVVITPTAMYPRGVTSYSGGTLTLDATIPVALDVNTTLISYLMLVRLVEDEITLSFEAQDAATVPLHYTEIV